MVPAWNVVNLAEEWEVTLQHSMICQYGPLIFVYSVHYFSIHLTFIYSCAIP